MPELVPQRSYLSMPGSKKKKSSKISKLKKSSLRIDVNAFLVWVKALDIKEYPAQEAIIKRVQNYGRPSFVVIIIALLNIWLEGK